MLESVAPREQTASSRAGGALVALPSLLCPHGGSRAVSERCMGMGSPCKSVLGGGGGHNELFMGAIKRKTQIGL